MLAVKLEHFEGPLDLLLHLIEEEKLDITEISLARVADQYLGYLAQFSDEHHLDELADFIVIAAKLLLIKSRALVPLCAPEEEEEIEELKTRLKMYRTFIDAGKKIDALFKKHRVAFPRRAPLPQLTGFVPPSSVTPDRMRDTFARLLRTLVIAAEKPKEIVFPVRVSIKEKIQHIVTLLAQRASFRFRDIISDVQSKADAVVSFMALLELVKQRDVAVSQESLFDDIVISRTTPSLADTRGQTLIEVITALAILAIGLVGILSLATSNVRNEGIGLSRLLANNLAREGIEISRNIRDTNWLSGQPWHAGLVGAQPCAVMNDPRKGTLDFLPCPAGADFFEEPFRIYQNANRAQDGASKTVEFDERLQKGIGETVAGTPTAFYRKLQLDLLCLTADASAETLSGCTTANAIGLRVTSEVAWQQSGGNHLVRLRENLYNWR